MRDRTHSQSGGKGDIESGAERESDMGRAEGERGSAPAKLAPLPESRLPFKVALGLLVVLGGSALLLVLYLASHFASLAGGDSEFAFPTNVAALKENLHVLLAVVADHPYRSCVRSAATPPPERIPNPPWSPAGWRTFRVCTC